MKILRVDTGENRIDESDLPEKYERYGGRALTSRIVAGEVPAGCHPLGPLNKLVISIGLLGGTSAPNSGRISIGTKSPLTGGIKESNVGGRMGVAMANAGIRAIVIEGIPGGGALRVLVIGPAGASLDDASQWRGLGTYELADRLREKYGPKMSALCIGPAGEQRLAGAATMATDMDGRPSRAAGRGGTGAVLGAKGIKAVVMLPGAPQKAEYHDKKKFREITSAFSRELAKAKAGLTKFGTAGMVAAANAVDGLPTRNYETGTFERAGEMDGQALHDRIVERGGKISRGCHPGCVIRCSNIYTDDKGEYVTASLEYETMVMTGPNLDISDLDALAAIDRACDDMGVDTIETGAALGVAMEMGLIESGSADAVLKSIYEIREGTLLGKLAGSGVQVMGKALGARRVPEVKGQSTVAYDPRSFKGMGCAYATSPMGADHTAGPAIPGRGGLDPDKTFELTEAAGQVELTRDLQIMIAVCDSLGYCFFVGPDPDNMKRSALLLNALYGWELTYEDILDMGVSTLNIEKEFNARAGIGPGTNRLPDFFYYEKLPQSGRSMDISHEEFKSLNYNL